MPEAKPGSAGLPPEGRLPCPVCLGVKLVKVRPGQAPGTVAPDREVEPQAAASGALVLDRCERCGGIWFDAGEVDKLRQLERPVIGEKIGLDADAYNMQCHSCQSVMERNAERCEVCRWRNLVDCPVCARTMERRDVEGLHLDFCTPCRGVWFDRIELAEIWNLHAGALGKRRVNGVATAAEVAAGAADVAAELLIWNPELFVWGGQALGHGARAAAHLLSEAPEVLSAAVGAGGDLAGSVFEVVAEIIGALLD